MTFEERRTRDQRLLILRLLSDEPGYSTNESMIDMALEKIGGHFVSRDTVRALISWLDEQGLVTLSVNHDVYVATVTQRGKEVAEGTSRHPGVKKPAPGK